MPIADQRTGDACDFRCGCCSLSLPLSLSVSPPSNYKFRTHLCRHIQHGMICVYTYSCIPRASALNCFRESTCATFTKLKMKSESFVDEKRMEFGGRLRRHHNHAISHSDILSFNAMYSWARSLVRFVRVIYAMSVCDSQTTQYMFWSDIRIWLLSRSLAIYGFLTILAGDGLSLFFEDLTSGAHSTFRHRILFKVHGNS